jgi:pimeloyl-ACP methyl ester carboxylesterase
VPPRLKHARIVRTVNGLFVPGWGAHAGVYEAGMPDGWEVLEPPSFQASGGALGVVRRWVVDECSSRAGPFALGGHSFGAALAVFAALDEHVAAERLVLVNPAVLPLTKPVPRMLFDFFRRLAAGWFPPGEAEKSMRQVVLHPIVARRLGNEVRALDLTAELGRLRERGLPARVIGTTTDTLTTPAQCRHVAELAGADYREIDAEGGHLWFLRRPDLLAAAITGSAPGT